LIVVVHGVSGSGKTTIGRLLAERLRWEFLEGDDFHSDANKERMRAGIALTDEDRLPWLRALHDALHRQQAEKRNAVFAISALKQDHRSRLRGDLEDVHFVFLDVDPATVRTRLEQRRGHFFNPRLLESQFADLQRPTDSFVVDASRTPGQIVDAIVAGLRLE
jgi:gluconokinase